MTQIEEQHSGLSALSRRRLMGSAGAGLAGIGVLGALPGVASAARGDNNAQQILNIAATAEVLATIVNTVGPEKLGDKLDAVTRRNIQAAAQQEKNHFEALTGALGAKELTRSIYVPDEVFASKENLLRTLVAGDGIFVSAYLIGTTVFARDGKSSKAARYAAEIMGVEAVHRALALQSLGELGNDLAYMPFQFKNITTAVKLLQRAGFGFGAPGSKPGTEYKYDEVSRRTPTDPGVSSLSVK